MAYALPHAPLPPGLEGLSELAMDLRWTSSQEADRVWEMLDAEAWERTNNPCIVLQNASAARLNEAAKDEKLKEELHACLAKRKRHLEKPGWFQLNFGKNALKTVAYFSMEFGLSEALPIYSGGLGILAGDHLKSASDLGVPVVGVGLLYQQGYFRQSLSEDGWQLEAFPYNDPNSLPVSPVQDTDGGWLRIKLNLPGRHIVLRVWRAQVGRVNLYLLDSNDPLNSPWDRGITANLYSAGLERRLIQQIVLGMGGWYALRRMGIEADVCHLNEGHAAFAVLARTYDFMLQTKQPFHIALWATRAGNVFTTHTPVAAAFDRYEPSLIRKYAQQYADMVRVPLKEILALGRYNPDDDNESFNMTYLAVRGSCFINGVSRLHGRVSRQIFARLFPRWPLREVPVKHVTNGVHVPSWDSPEASRLWSKSCGEELWMSLPEKMCTSIADVDDATLWDFRGKARARLVEYVRRRFVRQVMEHAAPPEKVRAARRVLDPNVLTLGFARRFTSYKRPTLLLRDPERLKRILLNRERPVQLIIAGKAHPDDKPGKMMVRALAQFAAQPELFDRTVFLEDYDMTLARHLAFGIDVWLNTPLRPWEASGTSGMKVLVNGGLNLSELDGWWEEAYEPDVGWALGDGREHAEPEWDAVEADQLYTLLEQQIIPEFYERDAEGIPRTWIARARASMSKLTARYSSNRMLGDYVKQAYLPAAAAYRCRIADSAKVATELHAWHIHLAENWKGLRFGGVRVTQQENLWCFEAQVFLGELDWNAVRVEIYAEPLEDEKCTPTVMERCGQVTGAINSYIYIGYVPASRPAEDYTVRIVPYHPDACVPLEDKHILWQH